MTAEERAEEAIRQFQRRAVTPMTYQTILDKLNACKDADDLSAYAEWLYASDALDESEQTTMIGYRGPLAPWSAPDEAEEIWSNGEDAIVRLSNGNLAAWSNMDRAWSEPDEDDERLPLISPTFETKGDSMRLALRTRDHGQMDIWSIDGQQLASDEERRLFRDVADYHGMVAVLKDAGSQQLQYTGEDCLIAEIKASGWTMGLRHSRTWFSHCQMWTGVEIGGELADRIRRRLAGEDVALFGPLVPVVATPPGTLIISVPTWRGPKARELSVERAQLFLAAIDRGDEEFEEGPEYSEIKVSGLTPENRVAIREFCEAN